MFQLKGESESLLVASCCSGKINQEIDCIVDDGLNFLIN